MVSTLVRILGYHITEELYNGSRTLVYRGYREADSLPVTIKLLKNPYPSFGELLSFRNQYAIAKNLNSPLIVQSYCLQAYQNGYALVMEDFGGISLKEWQLSQSRQSLQEFLVIAIALCDTLDLLYHERIIHKDIKPSNILINPATKQVKLIDFSIASLLPQETQTVINPNVLEGTLAYISPEQTGRMNRGIDYRTDLYSLGVTFYELLTGELPFAANDPMELVHCHIAKLPLLVYDINRQIPFVLSEIVNKLMAKNAENRYQSALGLKFDLENCLTQLQVSGKIESFEIASRDVCDRFIIPDKLYGRDMEVQTLLQAFERVSLGATEMMLVAGFSGIGKTAIVNEVHKPIVRQRGYFIKGKFDQFNRNIPLSAFVQAFRDLMEQLLSETDERLAQWKEKILCALGENGQVLIEVIPELEQIIGKQPSAPELNGSAAQNRFNLVFVKFIAAFATLEHPLVIFFDDLQWADSASLSLMQVLMSQSEVDSLLTIGAYRDNEVFPSHPLMLILEEMKKAEATISTLTLTPLSQSQIDCLVADTLSCSPVLAQPLAELVYQKTKGNPFFATQFLRALHQENYITYNLQVGHWQCDMVSVKLLSLTDDVVEFMAQQLQKLPQTTQEILKLAACVGAQFDLETLAIVSERSPTDAATALWKALQLGLILPTSQIYKFFHDAQKSQGETVNPTYRFLHDRVQQAAYSLIPDDRKQATHLKIGQLLLQNTAPEVIELNVFDIVNQLNNGIALINRIEERYELAQLNLIAGKKAKVSTAYKAAIKYCAIGMEILPEDSWQTAYDLTFQLYRECAECEYITGRFDEAERLFHQALRYAQNKFELADIYGLQLALRSNQGENLLAAYEVALSGLSVMGMSIPTTDAGQQALIESILKEIRVKLETVQPADLFDLPAMTDPAKKVCMSILPDLWGAAYVGGNQALTILSILLMVQTSFTYGNAESSGCAYCLYGMMLTIQGDYRSAYEFATLGRKLDRQFNSAKFIPKTNNVFGHTINPYNKPLLENIAVYQQSVQISYETGDIGFGIWAVICLIWTMLLKGDCLSEVYGETEKYLSYVQQVNNANMTLTFNLQQQFLLHLQGLLAEPDLLVDRRDRQIVCLDAWQKNNFEAGINWYCFLKLQLLYLYGRYADALEVAAIAEKTLASNLGLFPIVLFHFYYPLNLAALYPKATPENQQQYWNVMQQHHQLLETWAETCPENFLHQSLLLGAEMARVSGNYADAIACYDRAITAAKENHFSQIEALANELAAKFYLEWDKERIAQEYMIPAYYGYVRWGAKAKVADLEKRYPQLLAAILQQTRSPLSINETIFALGSVTYTSSATSSSSSDSLDLAAILKASQTLSEQIELEKLLSSLLKIVIEDAGADKCVLMLLRDDRLLVKGLIVEGSQPIVLQRIPIEESQDIPLKLIYKVLHNRQTVVLVDATADPTLTNDPYIVRQQPKSILCSPILHQGQLKGILYLENNLAMGAFTSDRVELLNLICTQAAISLENARLYERSLEYAQQLERSLAELSASNSRFEKLVDNVPGVVYQYQIFADGAMSLTYMSRECYELYEITAEQAIANVQLLLERMHPDDVASYQQSVIDSMQTLTPFEWSGRIITLSGMIKWIHSQARIEQKDDGTIVWDGFLLDISDRRKAELALEEKSFLLQQALTDLQNAQLQTIQSEKMSALGNLVAGVAHEMNNPLGFIAASLQQTQPVIADLTEHLKLYQTTFPNSSEEIIDHAEQIDLEYSLEDASKVIESMTMACNRLKKISTSLCTFSRADQDYKVLFNIHEGIDSTLLILKHRLKANQERPAIEVITNYGNLPPIECFPGQLNQVFMNILANAIDAIDESNIGRSFQEIKTNPNCITINTSLADRVVKITIADNGKGISESVKQKIFEHLFTTKAVGKGTGLGLAIARQIVESTHGGKLSCNSVLGEGTEFIIEIPV
ncbi:MULTISPECIES: ATP-binding sensor histidine kinase [unclassified Nostoc]|uniref:trifunctional serine/threonine-protein kinase/ATP-binding protein/sensor histidine kinase n=1 Tax=unclassified Nostoc TaxID=2593658 RepID=UPI002AD47932|nr:ATP-binding sensor histidine kinase [Nostoc sp. DedQUE03]MDZ7974292.1 ATP-binding sensor histidine kinase [Nostoc sp. DedQUE03]MDZ8043587.1 ATP-binding sensor histidine kinase [Nostoc sp. DedQUE02]